MTNGEARIPALDILMILVWLGFILLGALSGTVRQVLMLVALYAASIMAGTLYSFIAGAIKLAAGQMVTQQLLESVLLIVLFVVIAVLFYLGLTSVYSDTRPVGRSARLADTVLGSLLGVAAGMLCVVALYGALAFLVQPRWPTSQLTRDTLLDQVNSSVLQPVLADKLPVAYVALRPWFPRGLPGFPIT